MKECLQTGLQEHIKYNIYSRDAGPAGDFRRRKVDRRCLQQEICFKEATRNELKGDRKRKQHMQDSFYDDGFY
ncbi:hypothetical protein GQ600_43 [Phytophthora cactorum]|nr:hypothetical protein GQ600_43 [Phytophthora cactorum]